ncbi:MAG: hypothetical protein SGARI_006400 [Bacillariaceae sp.]
MNPNHHNHVKPTKSKSSSSLAAVPHRPRARFPLKLRTVLEDAANEGNDHIISWLPDGKAFKVHQPEMFSKVLMKRYFRQSHFRSFTRQLYHYGFERCEAGAFHHPLFQRDDEQLSWSMSRKMKGGDDVAAGSSSFASTSGGSGPLDAPTYILPATSSSVSTTPHALPIKNFDNLEDVRLQRSTLNPVPLPYHGMNNAFDPSFFSVQNTDNDGDQHDSKKPAAFVEGVKDAALADLMLEPRSIEQMQAQPLSIFMDLFGTAYNSGSTSSPDSKLNRNRTI